ncbi:tetratricopeptide repeat protein [Spirosoma fluviale]|uniref:Tetratricopeptide repeat-containing protein n=1 Tax=Spirosoma fluviale TaxID=1597977 RepID=A0A286G4V2_9BACT|nr:tetratricopeptide repeat protein [Spirosoma fluviale]SOD90561.1 Tetratricopeptide repeat-containing protein [Spirosoma fluviale]
MKKLLPYLMLTLIALVIYPLTRWLNLVWDKRVYTQQVPNRAYVNRLNEQCRTVWYSSIREASRYNQQALRLALRLNDPTGQAEAYRCLGVILLNKQDTYHARPYLQYAQKRFQQLDDKAGQAATLSNLGTCHIRYNEFRQASSVLEKAHRLYKEVNDGLGISEVMHLFGDLAYKQHNYVAAITHYQQSLTLRQSLGDDFNSVLTLVQLGHLYAYTDQRTIALSYFQKALDLATHQRNQLVIAQACLGMGMVFQRQGRYAHALTAYQRSARADETFTGYKNPWYYKQMADLYKQQQQFELALKYYQQSLQAPQTRHGQTTSYLSVELYQEIADLYQQQGKYAQALTQLQQAMRLIRAGNPLWIDARILPVYNRMSQLYLHWGKYALAKQQGLLSLQGAQKQRSSSGVQDAHLTLARIYAGQGDTAQAYRHHLQYTALRESRLLEEINTAAILKNNLAIHQKENQVSLLWQQTQQQNGEMKSLKQRNYALLASLLLFVILIGVIIRQYRHNQQTTRLIAEQDRQLEAQRLRELEQSFEHRQAESELAALRAQMNPHFIFNCLNSIKLYASDNEAAKASVYLTKFARLIRLVLENSRSERVSLQNELEALRLYCDMEIMRFKDKLICQITVEEGLDAEFVEIPPLLIQPYVENAIWHGLMHKENGGTVWIRVAQAPSDQLQVTITDDGVGRSQAARLASKSADKRKSFGMKMTSERLDLINQVYQTDTTVVIEDLMDAHHQPSGTRVVLHIPI